ncbi:protein stum [Planococcus citri]|uniref:protein stum n=1 Tax=Planococcus citri TaxID=170843 RepID=UPI0031F947E6
MNFTLIKIGPSDDEEYPECKRLNDPVPNHFVKTDSFTVLPPLSPQIPGPPPTPNPYRILPPIVSRKRPSFVIIQELGSRTPSRDPSPSGRVSPFRGCGFRPHSREASPTRGDNDENEKHQSRSRLPIAKRGQRKVSKSVSPVGTKTSGIPRPLNRRISYSPNRTQEILKEMNANKRDLIKPPPLKSSENLTTANAAVKSPVRQQKPPLPQKPTKPKTLNLSKTPDKKPTPVASPTKTLPRPEPKKITSPMKKSPSRPPQPIPKTPEKGKLNSVKSKENLAPKLPSPARSPTKITKLPPRSPSKIIKNEKKPPPKEPAAASTKQDDKTAKSTSPADKEKSPTSESADKSSEESKDKITAMKNIRRKAITTNILLNAAKKTKKPPEKKSPEPETKKEEEKKDLPHSDTSRSLPITIGSSTMTESSATLIRTTTEPALAPVEPDLINEIRSAIMNEKNEKKEEEICIKEVKKELQTNHTSDNVPPAEPVVEKSEPMVEKSEQDKIIESITQVENEIEKIISKSETRTSLLEKQELEVKNSPKLSRETLVKNSPQLNRQADPKNSPKPVHVVAVTKIEEPKQEITNVGKIKQEPDTEVASVNNPISNENRNGMSKSSWLNEKPVSNTMKKLSLKKSTKEHISKEILVEPKKLQSRWSKFKPGCPKCFKKSEKTVQISAITKAEDVHKLPKKSCFKQYFCCCCYKCKLKKGKKEVKPEQAKPEQAKPKKKSVPFRCFNCKHAFRSLFNKISCKKKKKATVPPKAKAKATKSDSGVACVDVPKKPGCCGSCKSSIFKCFSILCCLNTAFCLKLSNCCKKSCCSKCLCCGGKKKELTEPERRKSTISAPRKRRWTRMFTDFPKLDNSFVEHGSLMRGAIPVLPVPLAWICLILNVFLPGFGTLSSGIFCLFVGKPRFSPNDSIVSRIGAFLVNLLVAGSQLFTVLFCLVGWGWSVWWGVIMFKMAKKNKRIMLAEQAIGTSHATPVLNQNHDAERGLANG